MATQKQLEGMQDKADEAVTRAAKNYKKAVDDRQKKNVLLIQAKTILVDLMRSKKLAEYRDPEEDIVVTLAPGKDVLTVRTGDDEEPEESDDRAA